MHSAWCTAGAVPCCGYKSRGSAPGEHTHLQTARKQEPICSRTCETLPLHRKSFVTFWSTPHSSCAAPLSASRHCGRVTSECTLCSFSSGSSLRRWRMAARSPATVRCYPPVVCAAQRQRKCQAAWWGHTCYVLGADAAFDCSKARRSRAGLGAIQSCLRGRSQPVGQAQSGRYFVPNRHPQRALTPQRPHVMFCLLPALLSAAPQLRQRSRTPPCTTAYTFARPVLSLPTAAAPARAQRCSASSCCAGSAMRTRGL